ncbi:SDR family NAD(P)-dependent oxidoreductase [Cohnella silvisoli]|uniref:SDR family NAD(P)-dependent oxidoreductase n=1 Tax=Cohnella silvisoli TaxID=2873699 RepID=A0ABV1KPP7_9BACL|nr:SDR family NAD(P)-dependent oxidoreductase [Cohnella silvisoli]MCD9022313.1 polysaccharide biosynthesis protein [Cohnella silvisoli]
MNEMYRNKKILIIGGTGTIGQHLLKHLLEKEPAVIRIFSRDEHKQFELQQKYSNHDNIRFLIGDIRDYDRLVRAMEGVDFVFHTAAMKHVPSCEYNPFEAVQTNIIGTQNVIQAALYCGVSKVLFTSTDKAIAPTNTYGASKLTAERLISSAQYHKGEKPTILFSVRFGNVMGSRGSVIPLFKSQIREKKDLSITDPEMVRYMMTPSQAISLMLEAMAIAQGGEVFVLKMPVIKLSDLAEVIIEETSKSETISHTVSMRTVGLRPGEKMYEELMTSDESRNAFELDAMYIIPPAFAQKPYDEKGYSRLKDIQFQMGKPIGKEILRDWLITEGLV